MVVGVDVDPVERPDAVEREDEVQSLAVDFLFPAEPVVTWQKKTCLDGPFGWEPWSSGYGRRLIIRRSWVRIPAPNTGWTFFTYLL